MPDTPTRLRIFVSHSGLDKAICDQVVKALRDAGADVWYDEHDLGVGELLEEIQRELLDRPVFIVLLSKSAFAASWVKRETMWAFNLYNREPNRLIMPLTVGPIEPTDFNAWLFIEGFKRVEGRGMQPLPPEEMIAQSLRLLTLPAKGHAPAVVAPRLAENGYELITQGRALSAQGKYDEALPFFERAIQSDPTNFDAWFNLGYTLGELNRWTEAIAADEHAIAIDPNNAVVWRNKGVALNQLDRNQEALQAFNQALLLDPGDSDSVAGKDLVQKQLNIWEIILRAANYELSVDPNSVDSWKSLALALRGLGRTGEAQEAERRAKELGG